jgi:arylsulfatase A
MSNNLVPAMPRREFLGLLTAACASTGQAPSSRSQRLNVVFILADDLGWADTTPYGADLHETPNLEKLARASVKFTRAYAAAPVCSPTRASILTGKYPARLHMTIWREYARRPPQNNKVVPPIVEENLPYGETTLAEAFQSAGYLTAHVGKWHLGGFEHYPEAHGFDINIGGTGFGAPVSFFYPYQGMVHYRYGDEYRYVPGLHGGKQGEYLTDRLTTEALKVIDSAGNRPFFLNLWYHNPHTPIQAKKELVEHYTAKLKPGMHHRNATYAAMVHSLDENVGRVLSHLERKGLSDNTLVVFASDNGGFLGPAGPDKVVTDNYPLRSGKGSLYEGGIRVPLLIRWPGATPAQCSEPVSSIDFHPTIREIAGLRMNEGQAAVDGMSLVPLLKDPGTRLPREELFFHYPHYYPTTAPVSAVMTREHKLLRYYEDQRVELFHLGRDLSESRDLSTEDPGTSQRLGRRLEDWLQSVKAQLPEPNRDFVAPK